MRCKQRGRPPKLADNLLQDLRAAVGRRFVINGTARTRRYAKGYRIGGGALAAVARPASLVELWHAADACIRHGAIVIVQAANTGLTGGSTPFGEYDRPVVLISTSRISGIHILDEGNAALCLAGSTLTQLEDAIRPFGRMPHSVIGSSCIGASVVGGICNSSGGALVHRGPAFTQQSLYARVTEEGKLCLHNGLGRDLGNSPEAILSALDRGEVGTDDSQASGSCDTSAQPLIDYTNHVREKAPTPARYNADPLRLFEASGCAGKLIVFAVRVPTFPAPREERSYLVGSNSAAAFASLRRAMLDQLDVLPSVCEYMHRSASNLAANYGRDICQTLALLGPAAMPSVLGWQRRFDAFGDRLGLGEHLSGRVSQRLSTLGQYPAPAKVRRFVEQHEHVLLVTAEDCAIQELEQLLDRNTEISTDLDFQPMTPNETDAAFRLRFASAGATVRLRELSGGSCDLAALDIALPRDTQDWLFNLPDELEQQVEDRAIYGHFLCHVFHLDYVLKPGNDATEFEQAIKALVERRGGQMPAEHNFGHLYRAPEHVERFYRKLDPTNSLNPGIGRTSRRLNWAE